MSARAIEDDTGGNKSTREALKLAFKLEKLGRSETKNKQGYDYFALTDSFSAPSPVAEEDSDPDMVLGPDDIVPEGRTVGADGRLVPLAEEK
jgi:hypothetical protein